MPTSVVVLLDYLRCRRPRDDERGVALVEYVLIVGLIGVVAIVVLDLVGDAVAATLSEASAR
ncbi:MAG: hypothetical protein M3N11_00790 [Actinomycetota bacterium]|nr:hypothetical protein [Actinomycetota bacterium]